MLLIFTACHKEEDKLPLSKSTLIYMVADNNLDYYAVENIKKMEQGIPENAKGNIFVFIDRNMNGNPNHPYLLQIHRDTTNNAITSTILQTYREQNSCHPQFLRSVIDNVWQYCNKQNSVLSRLVLWSHGTGWLPEETPFNDIDAKVRPLSFGMDNTGDINDTSYHKEMDIKDLKVALNGLYFELLIIDACFMGSIEVAYELRNNFDYMILSPSEILSSGFPYIDISEDLVSDELDARVIADRFFNHYNSQSGVLQSATISVIHTEHLENLASKMQYVYQKYVAMVEFSPSPIETIPQYDRTMSNYFFDFGHFLSYTLANDDYDDIMGTLNNILPYYKHTEQMFSTLDLSATTGLSVYIPNTYYRREWLHTYYQMLEWTKNSGADILLGIAL